MLRTKKILVVALFAAGLLWSSAAGAAKFALVDLSYFLDGFGGPTPAPCCTATAMSVTVKVGSTPGTPYVKWPASLLKGTSTTDIGGTFGPSGTPNPSTIYGGNYFSFHRTASRFNQEASLMKSNIPVGTGTIGTGGTAQSNAHVQNWPTMPTTICNNSCAPRAGQIANITPPGGKRFGGSARLISITKEVGIVKIATGSYGNLDINIGRTSMLLDLPAVLSNFGQAASSDFVTTMGGAVVGGAVHGLSGVATTGTVRVVQPSGMLATDFTRMGENSLNPTNLTGMISTVAPSVTQNWSFFNGFVTGPGGRASGVVRHMQATFLVPEPSFAVALGAGALCFAAVGRRRLR